MPTVCSALTDDENNCAPAPCDIGVTPVYRLKGGLNLTVIRQGTVLSLLVNNPDNDTCKISGITGTFTEGDDFFAPPDNIITKEEVKGGGYLYKIDYTKVAEKDLKQIKGSLTVTYKCAGDAKSTDLPLIFTFNPTGDLKFVQG